MKPAPKSRVATAAASAGLPTGAAWGMRSEPLAAPHCHDRTADMHTTLRVVKKLAPNQRGAVALTREHGAALVCVRHRQDAAGAFRYTTVELLVDCRAIVARNEHAVGVQVDFREAKLRSQLRMHGGRWDPRGKLWVISRRVAAKLGLQDRVIRPYE